MAAVQKYDDRLTIRKITEDRRDEWERAAEAEGRPLSQFIRYHVDKAARKALGAGRRAA